MKSTIKIDYDRSQEIKPCIKIITPTNAGLSNWEMETGQIDDDDPRDKLVWDFLWTPRNTVENYLFEVGQRFEVNDGGSLLTTISAIPEEEIFSRLETAILGRLVGDENILECSRLLHSGKSEEFPAPDHYDKYLKISEFFNWVNKQKYHNDKN